MPIERSRVLWACGHHGISRCVLSSRLHELTGGDLVILPGCFVCVSYGPETFILIPDFALVPSGALVDFTGEVGRHAVTAAATRDEGIFSI